MLKQKCSCFVLHSSFNFLPLSSNKEKHQFERHGHFKRKNYAGWEMLSWRNIKGRQLY